MIDSIRFKKEASRCELAAKIAEFLEANVPDDYYDFVVYDLLYFNDEIALSELRENPHWLALESQFQSAKGLIVEDWDCDCDCDCDCEQVKNEPKFDIPVANLPQVSSKKNRVVGLLVCVVAPAIVGGMWGWFNPPRSAMTQTCIKSR